MKKLYTINGKYPDVDFNFTLTPDDIGSVVAQHEHTMADFGDIRLLTAKSDIGHEHSQYLHAVVAENAPASDKVDFISSDTVSAEGATGEITINNISPDNSNGVIKSISNANDAAKIKSLKIAVGNASAITMQTPSIMFLGGE